MRCWLSAVRLFEGSCFWFYKTPLVPGKACPHPQPFSRREKGVLGRWAQVLSRPVVARMERGGGRGRGVNNLTGTPDSVSLHPGYGFWVRVWLLVALIPSPSPTGDGRTWMRIGSAHGCAHPGHGRDTFILTGFLLFPRFRALWAVSSAVEHCLHTAGVTGSIPVPPTIFPGRLHSAGNLGAGSRRPVYPTLPRSCTGTRRTHRGRATCPPAQTRRWSSRAMIAAPNAQALPAAARGIA